jgi:hypothetical protein
MKENAEIFSWKVQEWRYFRGQEDQCERFRLNLAGIAEILHCFD